MESLGLSPLFSSIPLISSMLLLITFIWMLIIAFGKSARWGFAILFFSPISTIIFAFEHWSKAKKPVVAFLAALIFHIYTVGSIVSSMFGGNVVNTYQDMQEIVAQRQQGELSEQEAQQKITTIIQNLTGQLNTTSTNPGSSGQQNIDNTSPSTDPLRNGLERLSGNLPNILATNKGNFDTSKDDKNHTYASPAKPQKSHDEAMEEVFGHKKKPDKEALIKRNREANAMHSKVTTTNKTPRHRKPIIYERLPGYLGKTLEIQFSDSRLQSGVLQHVENNHIVLYRDLSGGRFTFEIYRDKIKNIYTK